MLNSSYKKVSDAFAKHKSVFQKAVTVLSKVLLYALVPFYLLFVLLGMLISLMCRGVYRGLVYTARGTVFLWSWLKRGSVAAGKGIKRGSIAAGKGIKRGSLAAGKGIKRGSLAAGRGIKRGTAGFLRGLHSLGAGTLKVFSGPGKLLRGLLSLLARGILILLVPPIFLLLLVVILFSKVFPFVYRWIAYGITGLRVILTIAGGRKGTDTGGVLETVEFTGFKYDPGQDIFYSAMDAWQRKFGYCRLYDEAAAPWGMIVDCEPVYLEYEGKKWLIEFWKGQYDLTTGAEIGVYTTEGPSLDIPGVFNGTFYNSADDEDLLQVSFRLLKGNKVLIDRQDEHWWLTGFKLGEFSKPSELTMEVTVTLKDGYMCNLFAKGLKNSGYSDNEMWKRGNTVSFIFSKPRTRQPFTRTRFTDWLIQRKNRYMCRKFQKITGEYNSLQDKLAALQQKAPRLYSKIMNLGRNIKYYSKSKKINSFFK